MSISLQHIQSFSIDRHVKHDLSIQIIILILIDVHKILLTLNK